MYYYHRLTRELWTWKPYSLHSRKLSLLVKLRACMPGLLACFSRVWHQHSEVNARYKVPPGIITLIKQGKCRLGNAPVPLSPSARPLENWLLEPNKSGSKGWQVAEPRWEEDLPTSTSFRTIQIGINVCTGEHISLMFYGSQMLDCQELTQLSHVSK